MVALGVRRGNEALEQGMALGDVRVLDKSETTVTCTNYRNVKKWHRQHAPEWEINEEDGIGKVNR